MNDHIIAIIKNYESHDHGDLVAFDAMYKQLEKEYNSKVDAREENNKLASRAMTYCHLDVKSPQADNFDISFKKAKGYDVASLKFIEKATKCFVEIQLESGEEGVFTYGVGAYHYTFKPYTLEEDVEMMMLKMLAARPDVAKEFFKFWITQCIEQECPCICFCDAHGVPKIHFDMLPTFSLYIQHEQIKFGPNELLEDKTCIFPISPEEFESYSEIIKNAYKNVLLTDAKMKEKLSNAIRKEKQRSAARISQLEHGILELSSPTGQLKRAAECESMEMFFKTKKQKVEDSQ
jgi:hypothetical protein